jgi:hypothetical protein
MSGEIVQRIREECAWVAARARHVSIRQDRIAAYAAALPEPPAAGTGLLEGEPRSRECAFSLTMSAINFGSGWFPTLRKAPGRSGYHTVHDGLRQRFEQAGPWTAGDLAVLKAGEIAATLGQDPEHELMALFAVSLNDLGERLISHCDGSFEALVEQADHEALQLVETLAGWRCFEDSSLYEGREVPFLKRAQLAAADLARARVARFRDLDRLTMFADNLVPHVLRLDGLLAFDPQLVERIERHELIEHGSPAEVEIRACAVHAVELLVEASPVPRTPADIDELLWSRGGQPEYKARPRHRSRCTAY